MTLVLRKTIENHRHVVVINVARYDFRRTHKTFRMTPAVEAGLAGHVWEIEELPDLIDP